MDFDLNVNLNATLVGDVSLNAHRGGLAQVQVNEVKKMLISFIQKLS